jgi:cysteine desulfurase
MSIQNFRDLISQKTYLDYNASTPVLTEVLNEMLPYFSTCFYNMSNPYSVDIQNHVESLRSDILQKLGAKHGKIVFYSGATEALNAILQGVSLNSIAKRETNKNIIVSAIEHDAVIVCGKDLERLGVSLQICPVNKQGEVILEELNNLINENTILVSIMHVNNETGVIQPLKEISKICRTKEVPFHSDGVLAVGRVDISNVADYVDFYTISANKFYGPKGISLNYISAISQLSPLICGSSQEENLRAGTQNVPNIIGMCKAFSIIRAEYKEINKLERELIKLLKNKILSDIPNIKINGEGASIIDNTLNISFKGLDRHDILQKFINKGVLVNIGATYLNEVSSHVIKAMCEDEDYHKSSIRFSVGKFSTVQDIEKASEALHDIVLSA